MQKRGQVTFFIVIGIFIIFSFLFLSLFSAKTKQAEFNPVDKIRDYVEECTRHTINDGIKFTALQGSFYQLPKTKAMLWDNYVPYFYGPGAMTFSQKIWEQELAHYVEDRLDACTQSFWIFSTQGVQIETKEKRASVMIRTENVLVTLSYPLTIQMGDTSRQLSEFIVVLPVRLPPLIAAIEQWNKEEKKGELCLSCLFELGQQYGVFVRVYPGEQRTMFYEFIDLNTIIEREYLVFSFAEGY